MVSIRNRAYVVIVNNKETRFRESEHRLEAKKPFFKKKRGRELYIFIYLHNLQSTVLSGHF